MRNKTKPMTAAKQKAMILAVFADFLEDGNGGVDNLIAYCQHCGISLTGVGSGAQGIVEAILGRYQIGARRYDVDRAVRDLATYPPITRRLAELGADRKFPDDFGTVEHA